MEKALKKRDKLLEESERKAQCLKEEYEYLGLRISSGRGGVLPYENVGDARRLV